MNFFLLIFFSNHPLRVSNRLTIHHQELVYCRCSIRYFALLLAAYVTGSFCIFLKQLWFMQFSINFFEWGYVHFFSCSCTLKLWNDSWVLIHQHIFHLYIWMLQWASCYNTVHLHVHCMYLLYGTVFLHPIQTLSLISLLVLNLLTWSLHWLSHK